jgi:methylamine dehydrogenase accessory protein MauD
MTIWLILNSLGLAAVGVLLLLALRQIGFILQRVNPLGARSSDSGPRIGENLSHFLPAFPDRAGRTRPRLVMFGSENCSICAQLRAGAHELARSWNDVADIHLIYDCDGESATPPVALARGLYFQRDCHLRKTLGASFVPFAVITDHAGTVLGKALVNEIAHMESLLELERTRTSTNNTTLADQDARGGATA